MVQALIPHHDLARWSPFSHLAVCSGLFALCRTGSVDSRGDVGFPFRDLASARPMLSFSGAIRAAPSATHQPLQAESTVNAHCPSSNQTRVSGLQLAKPSIFRTHYYCPVAGASHLASLFGAFRRSVDRLDPERLYSYCGRLSSSIIRSFPGQPALRTEIKQIKHSFPLD